MPADHWSRNWYVCVGAEGELWVCAKHPRDLDAKHHHTTLKPHSIMNCLGPSFLNPPNQALGALRAHLWWGGIWGAWSLSSALTLASALYSGPTNKVSMATWYSRSTEAEPLLDSQRPVSRTLRDCQSLRDLPALQTIHPPILIPACPRLMTSSQYPQPAFPDPHFQLPLPGGLPAPGCCKKWHLLPQLFRLDPNSSLEAPGH